jgi:hypothetical protein
MTPAAKPTVRKALSGCAAVAGAAAVALWPAGTASAAADPAQRPAESHAGLGTAHRHVVADGATHDLRLTATRTLPASGGSVAVRGSGYNHAQGIFVAFCVVPDKVAVGDPATYTELPTPCAGGRKSTDGSARRIADNATGTPGITVPYSPHGSFLVTLDHLKPQIAPGKVCDVNVKCAVVTRADFTATTNRNYDLYIPVDFR